MRNSNGYGHVFPIEKGRREPAESTPCDHCATIPEERVRLVDLVDPISWGTIVEVRLCRNCRRELRGQLHNFDRGYEGLIPGVGRRKRSASDRSDFMARASQRATRLA